MDAYEQIQAQMAKKYGKETTTRKAIGDFMLSDNHAVNVKSNNVDKENYSPNMISITGSFGARAVKLWAALREGRSHMAARRLRRRAPDRETSIEFIQ